MEVQELETWLFNGRIYVTPKEAARYLSITHKTILGYILDGRLPVVRIESRLYGFYGTYTKKLTDIVTGRRIRRVINRARRRSRCHHFICVVV